MDGCASVRRKMEKSGRIIWKGSRMMKIIGIIMGKEKQWKVQ